MKRIVIDKNETLSAVVHKMLGTMEREITLVIPKRSRVGASLNNFHIFCRETETAGKKLTIESVDEEVLAFGKVAGIAVLHPFLEHGRALRDIVPRVEIEEKEDPRRRSRAKRDDEESARVQWDLVEEQEEDETEEGEGEGKKPKRPRRQSSGLDRRRVLITAFVVVAVILVGTVAWWGIPALFGSAVIRVNLAKIPWEYKGTFIADTAVSKLDPKQNILPAEAFSLTRNITQLFPATGSDEVRESARGSMLIYNAYSSTPQTLVATTRFATPDGKIFRLADKVVVPGAGVRNGVITPATTTAAVVADKPGEEYNVGPVTKLTIPAFRGSQKFDGFYGMLPEGVKGGYVGIKKVPTPKDIEMGRAKTIEVLRASLEGLFRTTKPPGFTVPEGGVTITHSKLAVNPRTDVQGNFSVFGESVLTAVGFREEDLKELLLNFALAERDGAPLAFRSVSIIAKAGDEHTARRVAFAADVHAVLVMPFLPEELKVSVRGLSVSAARAAISNINGLEEGAISVQPFWMQNVPLDSRRITVETN